MPTAAAAADTAEATAAGHAVRHDVVARVVVLLHARRVEAAGADLRVRVERVAAAETAADARSARPAEALATERVAVAERVAAAALLAELESS